MNAQTKGLSLMVTLKVIIALAHVDTNLEEHLLARNVHTLALGGFMANCCVESTMRDACEKGFNVVTLTDCVATTTMRGYKVGH